MNRRKFIGMLAAAPVVAKAAPALKFFAAPAAPATIAEYADFISVSDMATAAALDPLVAKCAEELGYSAGLTVETLYRQAFA